MMWRFAPPLIPDGDEARQLAEQELAKNAYIDAAPTWFDRWARSIADFFVSLFNPDGQGPGGIFGFLLVVLILVGVLVAVFLVWGRPQRTYSQRAKGGELLGDDGRTAAQLRTDAARSAQKSQWADAIAYRFRAIARDLVERDAIQPQPGATAQAIARDAARPFPDEGLALKGAAEIFDDVRYLRRPATSEAYSALTGLDERLQTKHPEYTE